MSAQWDESRRPATQRTNRDILAALLRCCVDVKADMNPQIFHQKFIVRDYRGDKSLGKAALLTGSANFTASDMHQNLNHVIVFHDYGFDSCPGAKRAVDEFFAGTAGSPWYLPTGQ